MNARREPPSNRWLYFFCSVAVLLASWFIRPEAARDWFASQLAVLRSADGSSSPSGRATTSSETMMPVSTAGSARTYDTGRKITLYLPSRTAPGMLDAVEASIGVAETPKEMAVEAVNFLQSPPQETGRKAALPAGTRLLAIFSEGSKLTVDLSPEFLASQPASVAEARTSLYALVNTLTSLPFADEVRILVGDEERTSYFDCFDLSTSYRFNPDVVAQRGATGKSH